MARRLGTIATAVVAIATWLLLAVPHAGAATRDAIEVKQGPAVAKTYSGIPGNYAGNAAAIPTPSGCYTTGPFTTMCDTVPLDVVPPDIDPGADWTLVVTVTWEPNQTTKNDVQDVQACDLDIYLWDDRQISRREDPESGSFTELDSSALAVQPETVSTYAPDLGRYNLTIVNFSGANIEYTVKAEIVIGEFERPFEALAPTASKKSDPTVDDGETPPVDRSVDTVPAARPASGVIATASSLTDAVVVPDRDFAGFDAGSTFGEMIAAPAAPCVDCIPLPRLPAPNDVPVVLLLFWLVVAPLVIAVAGAVAVMRRSGARLQLS